MMDMTRDENPFESGRRRLIRAQSSVSPGLQSAAPHLHVDEDMFQQGAEVELPWASRGPADGASHRPSSGLPPAAAWPEMTSGPPSNPMTNHNKDQLHKINKSWANQVIRGQLVTFCRPYLLIGAHWQVAAGHRLAGQDSGNNLQPEESSEEEQ